ncbi:MAG: PTS system mannose/fructose/sorbose family transporter subunit IID [Cyanothece sp. SIO1E1]|nr:PTS system mannose/fructose/sorbose family transporter subunit IID [Cyanothece sp. SIO1E1]
MKVIENVIQMITTLVIFSIILWWTFFCVRQGYRLGQQGTENLVTNWFIQQIFAEKTEKKEDE